MFVGSVKNISIAVRLIGYRSVARPGGGSRSRACVTVKDEQIVDAAVPVFAIPHELWKQRHSRVTLPLFLQPAGLGEASFIKLRLTVPASKR
jgi:hypothetical protein